MARRVKVDQDLEARQILGPLVRIALRSLERLEPCTSDETYFKVTHACIELINAYDDLVESVGKRSTFAIPAEEPPQLEELPF
jgi:hypothetical protein